MNGRPDEAYVRQVVAAALEEDGASADATVRYLDIASRDISASIVARAAGVVAGVDIARAVFGECDESIRFTARIRDGARIADGTVVAELAGRAHGLLAGERVALNFLQRLSGVATLTAQFVDAVTGTGVTILDTRKTTPLLRALEKYAVRVGGGENHRYNLTDMILIKENHRRAIGGAGELRRAIAAGASVPVEIEVDSLELLRDLLGLPVDRLMLDNFTPEEVAQAVAEIAAYRGAHPSFAPAIEVSGGVGLSNVRRYAIEGVDYISVGALTHSAAALDMSFEVHTNGG